MSTAKTTISPEMGAYIERMNLEADRIIEQTHTLAGRFDIGDAALRRSIHLEATALACHWMEAFSEATPEMLTWAKLFAKRLELKSDAKTAYEELGASRGASQFFNNRRAFYRHNGVTFQPDEALLTSWAGIFRFSVMFRDMKVPPIIAEDQDAAVLMQPRSKDDPRVESSLGLDPNSEEYLEVLAGWLKDFTEFLITVTSASNQAFVNSMVASKKADQQATSVFNRFRYSFITLALWLILLPFFDFSEIWVFQLTKIGVTVASVFLAIILGGWQRVAAVIFAVLFNPLVPIQFDEDAWLVVDVVAGIFFGIVAFWPQLHGNAEQANDGNHIQL